MKVVHAKTGDIFIRSRGLLGVQLHGKISNMHLRMKLLVKNPNNWRDIEFRNVRSTCTIKSCSFERAIRSNQFHR